MDELFDFQLALAHIKSGLSVSRVGWNGPAQKLMLLIPDGKTKMTAPFIAIKVVRGDYVPWVASQTDLLAEDWVLVG